MKKEDDKDREKELINWALKNPAVLTEFIEKLLISIESDQIAYKVWTSKRIN